MREMNEIAILAVIRQHGQISRSQIVRLTGLTKSTVSVVTRHLIDQELVLEVPMPAAGRGRPESQLRIRPEGGLLIGAHIEVGTYRLVLLDLAAHILAEVDRSYDPQIPASELLEIVAKDALALQKGFPHRFWGLGLSIPGLVSRGEVLFAPNLNWHSLKAQGIVERIVGSRVFLVNDADAGAIGEYYFGRGKNSKLLVFLGVGTGIGSGVVIGGRLLRGAYGAFAEIGHSVLSYDGPPCRCGRRGCFEALASTRALAQRISERTGQSAPGLADILSEAHAGNPAILQALRVTAEYLAQGVINAVNIFDPDMLIVGGPMATFGAWILPTIQTRVRQDMLVGNRRPLTIGVTTFGQSSSAIGAAAMVLGAILSGTHRLPLNRSGARPYLVRS